MAGRKRAADGVGIKDGEKTITLNLNISLRSMPGLDHSGIVWDNGGKVGV